MCFSMMFRQSRFGWHILAVGGNRKAARHGGINVKLTIFLAYVVAGLIVGLSGFLFAARQNSIGAISISAACSRPMARDAFAMRIGISRTERST
jgi:ribose/xylose/arabinose/galactoside ABC-type transport system permease subunit